MVINWILDRRSVSAQKFKQLATHYINKKKTWRKNEWSRDRENHELGLALADFRNVQIYSEILVDSQKYTPMTQNKYLFGGSW